jgi:hypothetical protein
MKNSTAYSRSPLAQPRPAAMAIGVTISIFMQY